MGKHLFEANSQNNDNDFCYDIHPDTARKRGKQTQYKSCITAWAMRVARGLGEIHKERAEKALICYHISTRTTIHTVNRRGGVRD